MHNISNLFYFGTTLYMFRTVFKTDDASSYHHAVSLSEICLRFIGLCIVIYFYSKTNQMHNISNLFYFGTILYMFRTVFKTDDASSYHHAVPLSKICLRFIGLCIVIYFYSKTNQMHSISNLFYFGTTLYMFPSVSPSIIRSLRLYIYLMLYVQS